MGRSLRLLLPIMLALGQPALAGEMHTFTVAKWTGGAYSSNENGQFNHCAASSTYNSGISMLFAINRQYAWSIGFTHRAWTLTTGTVFDVVFTIDSNPPLTGQATALGPTQIAVKLADSAALFQSFRRGRLLNVYAVGRLFQFNLTDTSQILPVLLRCVASQGQPFQADRPPVVAARPQPGADSAAATASARAEATALAANILGQSGIGKFQILTPAEIPAGVKAHAVWKAGPILGTINVLPPDGVTKLEDIPGRIIGLDAQSCRGKFFSGSLPDATDSSPIARIFTTCQTLKGTMAAYYLGVPRDAGGFYVIATITTGADQSDPLQQPGKEADSNIRSAVFKVLSK